MKEKYCINFIYGDTLTISKYQYTCLKEYVDKYPKGDWYTINKTRINLNTITSITPI